MQQWEFTYAQDLTGRMDKLAEEAVKLCALGWEPVGIGSAERIGPNTNILIFKRPILEPLPAPSSNEEWQEDPTGRFDKRRWHDTYQVWTAETAMMDAKTLHTDPPRR